MANFSFWWSFVTTIYTTREGKELKLFLFSTSYLIIHNFTWLWDFNTENCFTTTLELLYHHHPFKENQLALTSLSSIKKCQSLWMRGWQYLYFSRGFKGTSQNLSARTPWYRWTSRQQKYILLSDRDSRRQKFSIEIIIFFCNSIKNESFWLHLAVEYWKINNACLFLAFTIKT